MLRDQFLLPDNDVMLRDQFLLPDNDVLLGDQFLKFFVIPLDVYQRCVDV